MIGMVKTVMIEEKAVSVTDKARIFPFAQNGVLLNWKWGPHLDKQGQNQSIPPKSGQASRNSN